MASLKTLVGGKLSGYTEMSNEARQIATKRMTDEAQALMQEAAEIVAHGTAVRFKAFRPPAGSKCKKRHKLNFQVDSVCDVPIF